MQRNRRRPPWRPRGRPEPQKRETPALAEPGQPKHDYVTAAHGYLTPTWGSIGLVRWYCSSPLPARVRWAILQGQLRLERKRRAYFGSLGEVAS